MSSEVWRTCRQEQIPCCGCGKIDSCTVSPDHSTFKCWRDGGRLLKAEFHDTSSDRGTSWMPRHWATLVLAAEHFKDRLGTPTKLWKYVDAQDNPALAIWRFDGVDGKHYRPFHLTADGWMLGDPPVSPSNPQGILPLYRLPEVLKSQTVWICEGEKAADAGRKIDVLCTTSAHGAASPQKSDWSVLAGKEVVILPDHDEPGRKYAQSVAAILLKLKNPPKVKIYELPGMKEGDDLHDFLADMKPEDWQSIRMLLMEDIARVAWITAEQIQQGPVEPVAPEVGPIITTLAQVQAEKIQWIWEGKLALGKLSGWAGAPGDGKSIASLDVAARLSKGMAWPDGMPACEAGAVLLISMEDGLADTIRPRLEAAGADLTRIHHFASVQRIAGGKAYQELFTLNRARELEKTLDAIPDCRLIIIDPVGSFFGTEVDSNGDAAVRSVLAPIQAIAEARHIAVLLIMHTRKEGGDRADDAVMGSRAFTGIVRSMWHIRRDDGDSERRLFLPGKNNTYKALTGLAYRLVDREGAPVVVWEDKPVEMTADQAVKRSGHSTSEQGPSRSEVIEDWLEKLLQEGARPAGNMHLTDSQPGTVLEEARQAGYAWSTVQRVAGKMGVLRSRNHGGTMLWMLPTVLAA